MFSTNQIKCWFLVRGENRSTRGKTSHSITENQQTQSTFDAECGNRTRATLWKASSLTTKPTLPPSPPSWCVRFLFNIVVYSEKYCVVFFFLCNFIRLVIKFFFLFFHAVVPAVLKALSYDELRGYTSVGKLRV